MTAWLRRLSAGTIVLGVRIYQRCLRPVLPPACRFQPSCSEYMIQAVAKSMASPFSHRSMTGGMKEARSSNSSSGAARQRSER